MGKFEIKSDKSGKIRFNLKAGNGQVILSSAGYSTKEEAISVIEIITSNLEGTTNFIRKKASNGSPYFSLVTANGRLVGRSEFYSTNAAMEHGISSVKRNLKAGDSISVDLLASTNLGSLKGVSEKYVGLVSAPEITNTQVEGFSFEANEKKSQPTKRTKVKPWIYKASKFVPKITDYTKSGSSINEYDSLFKNLGISDSEIATLLDIHPSTLKKWKKSNHELSQLQLSILKRTETLTRIGKNIFGSYESFKEWLSLNNPSFGGKKPIEYVLDPLKIDIVEEALEGLTWGSYT